MIANDRWKARLEGIPLAIIMMSPAISHSQVAFILRMIYILHLVESIFSIVVSSRPIMMVVYGADPSSFLH